MKEDKLKQDKVEEEVKPKRARIGGRQKGTPNKITATMRELASPYAKQSMQVIKGLLKSQNESIRLAAAKEVLDRAHGKSISTVETSIDQTVKIETTDTDLARRAAFMLTRAEKQDAETKH